MSGCNRKKNYIFFPKKAVLRIQIVNEGTAYLPLVHTTPAVWFVGHSLVRLYKQPNILLSDPSQDTFVIWTGPPPRPKSPDVIATLCDEG